MKNSFVVFLMLLISCSNTISLSASTKNLKFNSNLKQELVQVDNVYNFGDGSDGGNRLFNEANYKVPKMVEDLSKEKLTDDSDIIKGEVEEKESVKNYYNGELKLNKIRVLCKDYRSASGCYSISHCGWCGASNSCIEGTRNGPVERCSIKESYTYSK